VIEDATRKLVDTARGEQAQLFGRVPSKVNRKWRVEVLLLTSPGGEGRLTLSAAKCETGGVTVLNSRTFRGRDFTPPRLAFSFASCERPSPPGR